MCFRDGAHGFLRLISCRQITALRNICDKNGLLGASDENSSQITIT
ncbi:hypothetical protein AGRO_0598 [Agrobacterium sp. ATCC 31749]|nr:hypothetical protein AGRO_0598 [Agrobacterium sp. ATCC 31749]